VQAVIHGCGFRPPWWSGGGFGDGFAVLVGRGAGFLIAPELSPSARHDLIYRDHSAFLREFLPERTQTNHELRKLAASKIYTQQGLAAAAYFLGIR
jgi:hypothetical protein